MRGAVAVGLMLAGVLGVYVAPDLLVDSHRLVGLDYYQYHLPRMRYARALLTTDGPPGWFTRELLGTPFWSNPQCFPLIPTRLLALCFDPLFAYAKAVTLAAGLAALFTYLYARAVGLGRAGAAVAGWTFACAGFFASRVMAGHLPVLEAYPGLPLLLWLLERPPSRGGLLALGLAAAALMFAGHPQLPLYALATAAAYALVRHRGAGVWRVAAMVAGAGIASCVLWPTLLLVGRSTRVEMVDQLANNSALPLHRLAAFVFPWADGYPATVPRLYDAYRGPGGDPVFWDTVNFVGWSPLVAVAALALTCLARRRLPRGPFCFLGVAGALALVVALSPVRFALLRSPARLLYITTFALALAAGIAADRARRWSPLVLGLLVAIHVIDLGSHDWWFVHAKPIPPDFYERVSAATSRGIGDGRVAVDYNLLVPESRTFDDAGFFDPLVLKAPYRGVMALAKAPADRVEDTLRAGVDLPAAALADLCVKAVFTVGRHADLPLVADFRSWRIYAVPQAKPRARFPSGTATYRRPGPDHIEVDVDATAPGALEVVESWDAGWRAELDGQPAPVVASRGFLLGAEVPAGRHRVTFRFTTPGARTGLLFSLIFTIVLAGLVAWHPSAP